MNCKNCKKEISPVIYGMNHGLCNECKIKKIGGKQTNLCSDFGFPECPKSLKLGKK